MKRHYKTGKTQRDAVKRYQQKNVGMYKTISITLPSTEAEQSRVLIKAHGTTPVKVWRAAMERLNDEPLPSPGYQHKDE